MNSFFIKTIEDSTKTLVKKRPQTTKPSLRKSNTVQLLTKQYRNEKTNLLKYEKSSSKNSLSSVSNSFANFTIEDKPETYNLNFSLRDTEINTVLLKLDSQLIKFSKTEINKRHKETIKLHKVYNKLIEIQRAKEKEIETIETQILQIQTKSREKEEILQKISFLQFQTNKNLEKLVLAEAEGEYLVKIVNACLKNPPFCKE